MWKFYSRHPVSITIVFIFLSVMGLVVLQSLPSTINYRLTLEVEADGVVHTGSGVIETRWYPALIKNLGNPWSVQVHGEAVAVDLGKRGTLFALLTGPSLKIAGDSTGKTYHPSDPEIVMVKAIGHGRITTRNTFAIMNREKKVVELAPDDLPMLVRFRDIRDPMSIEQVDPDNLAAEFGSGVKLIRASLAITDEPSTVGIEKTLVWLENLNGSLDGQTYTSRNTLTNRIGKMAFKR